MANGSLPAAAFVAHYNPCPGFLNYNEAWKTRVEEIGSMKSNVYLEIIGNASSGSGGFTYRDRSGWQNEVIGMRLYDYYQMYLASYSMEVLGSPTSDTPGDVRIKCQFIDKVDAIDLCNNFGFNDNTWRMSVRVSEKQIMIGSGLIWATGSPTPSGFSYDYDKPYPNYTFNLGVAEISLRRLFDETNVTLSGFSDFNTANSLLGTVNSDGIYLNDFYFPSGTVLFQDYQMEYFTDYGNGSPSLVYEVNNVFQVNMNNWTQFWRQDIPSGVSGYTVSHAGFDTLLTTSGSPVFNLGDFTLLGLGGGGAAWTISGGGYYPGYQSFIDMNIGGTWNERWKGRLESFSCKNSVIHSQIQGPWSGRIQWLSGNFGKKFSGYAANFTAVPAAPQSLPGGMFLHKVTWRIFGDWDGGDGTPATGPTTAIGDCEYVDSMTACTCIPNFGWKIEAFSTAKEILIGGGLKWSDGTPYDNEGGGDQATLPIASSEIHQQGVYSLSRNNSHAMSGSFNLSGILASVGTVNSSPVELGVMGTNFPPDYLYWGNTSGRYYTSGTLLYIGCNISMYWCDPLETYVYPVTHIYQYNPQGFNSFWRDDLPISGSGGWAKTGGWDVLTKADGSSLIPSSNFNTNLNYGFRVFNYS
jgi:hypothetical protein